MPVTDFDFLPGRWEITNHKLVDGEWHTFMATSTAFAMLEGGGNHDHFVTKGYEGFSLRPGSRPMAHLVVVDAAAGPAGPAGRGPLPRGRDSDVRDRRRPRRRAVANALRVVGHHR